MKTKFKVGQVVLFNDSSSFFSKLITKYNLDNYGESKCVHAGIIARVSDDKVLIYEAKSLKINLPDTDDKDYESLDSLLRHIFRAARGYMTWMCDKLNLPDPEIEKVPESNLIEAKADEYMSHQF